MITRSWSGFLYWQNKETSPNAGRPDAALHGGLAVAVPLELKGLWLAHQRHGNLPWRDLVAPVIPLARDGFPLHPYLARTLEDGEW